MADTVFDANYAKRPTRSETAVCSTTTITPRDRPRLGLTPKGSKGVPHRSNTRATPECHRGCKVVAGLVIRLI